MTTSRKTLPGHGQDWPTLQAAMQAMKQHDVDWKHGRAAVYVFYAGEDVLQVAQEAYSMFLSENGLGMARAFPSLRQMEDDLIHIALELLHAGPEAMGHLTSGGTESIFLAMKAARDWSRDYCLLVETPEVLVPYSAHPAFDKAAQYLGMRVVRVPVRDDLRADPAATASAITSDTVMLVGSVPCFPYGVIDPIAELSAIAQEHHLWMHVDACVGGFLAPFVQQLGYPVPAFDFTLPGVCSVSADLHKYGFAAKGASVILYRSAEWREYQSFTFEDWPNGLMTTSTFAGTRPGGAIAAAWAVMHYLGQEGYRAKADLIIRTRQALEQGIAAIDGLHVCSQPELGILTYGSEVFDMSAVANGLQAAGWFVVRLQQPRAIQLMLTPAHAPIIDNYLRDLRTVVAQLSPLARVPEEVRYA